MSIVLFLSPHLDDAVFSCAGRILSEVQEGNRVIIATAFSHCGDDEENMALYEQRRDEDLRAGKILGAEMLWLGLSDAPFRNTYYNSFRRIVFGRHRQDQRWIEEVARVIGSVSRQLKPTRIYCPLGVGTHIDHRLVYEAVQLNLADGKVLFYEDRPYAFVKHAVQLRFLEIGAERWRRQYADDLHDKERELIWGEFEASFLAAPYVDRYLPAGRERKVCLDKLQRLLMREREKTSFCPRPEIEICKRVELQKVTKAVFAYKTQIEKFLGGPQGFRLANRNYAKWLNARADYVERYWRDG